MSSLKIGVLGCGHLGTIHAKLWKDQARTSLVGVYDTNAEMLSAKCAEFSFPAFASLDDAIAACDALTIAVPTIHHFEVARRCIEAGKHCLIEKPITQNYEEAQELIRLAEKHGTVLQVGHVERFNAAFIAARSYDLKPLFIEAHRLSQFRPRATDVSVIHDLMIHDIDIALWLVGSPAKSIEASGVAVITDTPDIANARIEFENGAVANLTASRLSATAMRKMRIFQKDAYLSLDFSKPSVEVYRLLDEGQHSSAGVPAMMLGQIDAGTRNRNIAFEQPVVPSVNAIAEEQKSFVETILDNAPLSVSAGDAAEALRIAAIIADQVEQRGSKA